MHDRQIVDDYKSYNKLMKTCFELDLKQDKKSFQNYAKIFNELTLQIDEKISYVQKEFSKIPLIAFITLWINRFNPSEKPNFYRSEIMDFFINGKLIEFKYKNSAITLAEYVEFYDEPYSTHKQAIETLRCYKHFTLEKREDYIDCYLDFFKWLSSVTYGYVPEAIDIERTLTNGRLLKFETYRKVVNNLLIRERILAKIFYIGGSRTLEEVFALKIEDVNFKESTLNFFGKSVEYPKHLFQDLKDYISPRKKGFIFISRDGNQIDPTVPYRALKLVTNKMDLDKSFTFMDFMKSA